MPLQNTQFFTHLYGAARRGIMGNLANMTNGSLRFVEPTPIVNGGRVHLSIFLVTKPSVEGEGERGTVVMCARVCVRARACMWVPTKRAKVSRYCSRACLRACVRACVCVPIRVGCLHSTTLILQ